MFSKRNYEWSHLINDSQQLPSTSDSPTQHVHPPINEELKNDIDTKLANIFYCTGISFRLVESEAFKDFVKLLNPFFASSNTNAFLFSLVLVFVDPPLPPLP